jgi:prephenate dehydratase
MEGVNATLAAKDANGALIPMTSANKGQDTSTYDAFQKEQLAVMAEAKYITQLLVQQSSHGSRIQRTLQRSKILCSHSGMHFLL